MQKIDLFKTKVIQDGKIYLLASDVEKALGYKSSEQFRNDYRDLVSLRKGFPDLVREDDFNSIALSNEIAVQKLKHIEITRVETLRSQTEALKSFYPLKYMISGPLLESKALKAGYRTVEEYIEQADFPNEIENEKIKLMTKPDLIEILQHDREQTDSIIDNSTLEKYGLTLQHYIHIRDSVPHRESFIVGPGIFFSVYDSDYAFDQMRVNESHDLVVPTLECYEDGFSEHNYGHDPDMRDYRSYRTLENIIHLITHKRVEDAGQDLLNCESPGISFYISQSEVIKLLNPNMYRELILIDGDVELDYSKHITPSD